MTLLLICVLLHVEVKFHLALYGMGARGGGGRVFWCSSSGIGQCWGGGWRGRRCAESPCAMHLGGLGCRQATAARGVERGGWFVGLIGIIVLGTAGGWVCICVWVCACVTCAVSNYAIGETNSVPNGQNIMASTLLLMMGRSDDDLSATRAVVGFTDADCSFTRAI